MCVGPVHEDQILNEVLGVVLIVIIIVLKALIWVFLLFRQTVYET